MDRQVMKAGGVGVRPLGSGAEPRREPKGRSSRKLLNLMNVE